MKFLARKRIIFSKNVQPLLRLFWQMITWSNPPASVEFPNGQRSRAAACKQRYPVSPGGDTRPRLDNGGLFSKNSASEFWMRVIIVWGGRTLGKTWQSNRLWMLADLVCPVFSQQRQSASVWRESFTLLPRNNSLEIISTEHWFVKGRVVLL